MALLPLYLLLLSIPINRCSMGDLDEILTKEQNIVSELSMTKVKEFACSLPSRLICLKSLIAITRKEFFTSQTTQGQDGNIGLNFTKLLDSVDDTCNKTGLNKTTLLGGMGDFFSLMDKKRSKINTDVYVNMRYIKLRFLCSSIDTNQRDISKNIITQRNRFERDISYNGSTMCLRFWRGDGFCDLGCNMKQFDYDNGDCCYETCISRPRRYPCGYTGFQCIHEREKIPKWIYGMSLCFRWRSIGDSSQCNNKPRGRFCAPTGSMTRYYHDTTDNRLGGCRLSWRIQAKSMPKWFSENFKFCFANYADGDSWQCNNGYTNRHRCVSVNRWVSYVDNTDDRIGGCYMSWKLQYIGVVPSWAARLKICFYWTSSNNQCQMYDEGNHHCASLNRWTGNYKDDTNSRKDGCEMAWGILI